MIFIPAQDEIDEACFEMAEKLVEAPLTDSDIEVLSAALVAGYYACARDYAYSSGGEMNSLMNQHIEKLKFKVKNGLLK